MVLPEKKAVDASAMTRRTGEIATNGLSPQRLLSLSQSIGEKFAAWPVSPATSIHALMVHPQRIFVFWQVHPNDQTCMCAANSTELKLRFYELAHAAQSLDSAGHTFDIGISGWANQRYVDVWEDDKLYRIVLGYVTPDNDFSALATSNTVLLPHSGVSEIRTCVFMDVNRPATDFVPPAVNHATPLPLHKVVSAAPDNPASTEPAELAPKGAEAGETVGPATNLSESHTFVPPPVNHAVYATPLPMTEPGPAPACETLPRRPEAAAQPVDDEPPRKDAQSVDQQPSSAIHHISSPTESSWPFAGDMARRLGFLEMQAELVVEGWARPELRLFFAGRLIAVDESGCFTLRRRLDHGALLFFMAAEPAPDQSDAVTMSDEHGEPSLVLRVFLCISGRVDPDKRLTLFGEAMGPDNDGCFHLKRALPDGAVVLPDLRVEQGTSW